MTTNKKEYALFCEKEKMIPIFSYPWWLDAVCGSNNWDVILVKKGNQIVASFPFYFKKSKFLNTISMPLLTQKLGLYIKYPHQQRPEKRLNFEKEIIDEIINKLPPYDFFSVNFNYNITNWLPFYWHGFEQSTRYTYIVHNLNDEFLLDKFASGKRTDIKKAVNKVVVGYGMSGVDFIDFYIKSLNKKGNNLAYDKQLFLKIHKEAILHNQGDIIYAVDKTDPKCILGAIFYIWDNYSIYSLVTALDPEYKQSAALSYLFYQIMLKYSNSGLVFDFEGSMVEAYERSYNKFGCIQTPYFQIKRDNTRKARLLRIIKMVKNEINNICTK